MGWLPLENPRHRTLESAEMIVANMVHVVDSVTPGLANRSIHSLDKLTAATSAVRQ
jgi:hypothetical protein